MCSHGSGGLVGLPHIKFLAADTSLTHGSLIVPVLNVGLTLDKLNVVWALGITISGTVLSTSSVSSHTHVTIFGHLNEIQGTVDTAWQVGHINIK